MLFFGRFFFNLEAYTDLLMDTDMAAGFEEYHHYAGNLDNTNLSKSLLEFVLYLIPMNYALISYNKMKPEFKFFTLCFTLAMILNGYLYSNLGRVLQFYHIYMIVLIPFLYQLWQENKKNLHYKLGWPLIAYMFLYCIYSFYNSMQHYLYCRWNDFQTTVFDAPMWM